MSTEPDHQITDEGADTGVFEELADQYEDGDEDDQRFAAFCRLAAQSLPDDDDEEVRI